MKIGIDRWKSLFGGEGENDLGIAGLRSRASQDPNVDITLLLWFATVVFKISVKIAKPHDAYYPFYENNTNIALYFNMRSVSTPNENFDPSL